MEQLNAAAQPKEKTGVADRLIYDWNQFEIPQYNKDVHLDDETLRDGLQSPSVNQPTIDEKLEILHLMDEIGINIADIGLPGAGKNVFDDVLRMAKEIVDCKLSIRAGCAARTLVTDIQPVIDISQKAGLAIEVHGFIGSSPIRQFAEGWDLQTLLKISRDAVKFSVSNGCPIMFVTEDTARSAPETIKQLLTAAIEAGATRVCLCDTVGHATPNGVMALIRFVREEVIRPTGLDIKIDWHGHSDRGLAIPNTLAAIQAGADRVHGTMLGIGERAGNTPMDLLLVNMKLLGLVPRPLLKLNEYCSKVSKYCKVPIPKNYPVIGKDAFRTATGVHAAAILKAIRKGNAELTDLVYSGVSGATFGFSQIIEIGPMSGRANVEYWLRQNGIENDTELTEYILKHAKSSRTILTEEELCRLVVKLYASRKRNS